MPRVIGGDSGVRPLQAIPFGSSGYSIPYLRASVCVGQTVIYIRHIQLDLDTSPIISEVIVTTDSTCTVHVYITRQFFLLKKRMLLICHVRFNSSRQFCLEFFTQLHLVSTHTMLSWLMDCVKAKYEVVFTV